MNSPCHPVAAASGSDLLALVGDAVVSIDAEGRVLLFNRAAEEIFGYAAGEMIGRPVETLLPERLHAGHAAHVRAFAGGAAGLRRLMGVRREVEGRRKSGEVFPVEAMISRSEMAGEVVLTVVARDISERRRTEAELEARADALRLSDERLRLALLGGRMGVWDARPGRGALEADATARRLWALPEDGPLTIRDAFERAHPEDLPALKAALDRAVRTEGEFRRELRVVAPDGETRWVACKGAVLGRGGGGARTVVGVTFDVTERREAEERRRLLSRELDHRLKNIMAVVQSVVSLSARDAASVEDYKRALQGRLGAITKCQDLLMESPGGGAELSALVRAELDHYRRPGGEVEAEGPPVAFDEKTALSLGLVLHELATNAAKYGALGAGGGRLSVRWRVEAGPQGRRLTLDWRETGGPRVSPPARKGFGTMLIEASLRALKGEAALDYPPEGLACRLALPLPLREGAG